MSKNKKNVDKRWQFKLETYGAILGAGLSAGFAYFLSNSSSSTNTTVNILNISEELVTVLWGFLILIGIGLGAKFLYIFNRISGYIDADGDVVDADELIDSTDIIDML